MENKSRTTTINGKTFDVPSKEILCKKCGTTNYYYDDNAPPYKCNNCGKVLVNLYPDPPLKNDPLLG